MKNSPNNYNWHNINYFSALTRVDHCTEFFIFFPQNPCDILIRQLTLVQQTTRSEYKLPEGKDCLVSFSIWETRVL